MSNKDLFFGIKTDNKKNKMKKIYNYIMLLFVAFAVANCTEEEIIENKVLGKPGEEVKFTLSLNKESRTAYDSEKNNTFPIYWVDGDKVQVYSPHASSGRNNAEYKVILPTDENDKKVEKPNYAKDLEKTGAYGVQWGEGYTDKDGNTGLHDFYSIYPSGNYEFSEDADGNMIAPGLRVKTLQEISYLDGTYTHDMSNCLMYAATPKVDMEDGVVNLSYKPLSTVLWFDVTAFKDKTLQDAQQTNFMITGIELEYTGTEGAIAGAFNYDVTNGKFIDYEEPYKKISVKLYDKSGTQELSHTVKAGESLNFPIFLAPSDLDLSNLKITIHTDNGTFTKTLSGTSKFKPGKIHKITLPELSKTSEGWDVSKWMTYIPRNVYLSEISIPGTWNSLNPEFQANTTIEKQYADGVRAFHFDTRWRRTGYIWDYQYSLGIADGNSTGTSGSKYCTSASPVFSDEFNNIISKVKDDEYMILVCTFAQGSAQRDGANGWIKVISELCENEKVFDARNIDNQTLVGHVLGKVIVIVNVESEITESTDPGSVLAANSKCFFNYTPSEVPKARFVSSDNTDDTLLSENSDVYWNTSASETFESDIKVYSTQAQISSNSNTGISTTSRGYAPTITERLKVLNLIVDWSKGNYTSTNYDHDQWIYLGLGGYKTSQSDASTVTNSHAAIENTLNPWINNKLLEMEGTKDNPYFPVGIVLMNNKKGSNYTDDNNANLNYKFTDVVKNILMLNNKYRLQYNPNAPIHTDDSYKDPYSYKDTDDEGNGNEDAM